MLNPSVSILIPCYNSEIFIERCVKSCINQTYKNFEIVIVNDGSTDNSKKIIESLSTENNNIKVIHQTNVGLTKTRNILLNAMNNEYGYFLDSDDWIEKDTLERFVNVLGDDNRCDMIIGKCIIHKSNNAKGYYVINKFNSFTTKEEFLKNNISYAWNILFKKTLIGSKIKFCEKSSFLEDAGVIPYAIYKSTNIKFLDHLTYHYTVNKTSLTFSGFTKEKIEKAFIQIENLYNLFRNEFNIKIPKYINDQLAFYHCVLFTYITFEAKLKRQTKKTLKLRLKNMEKNNWKLKLPMRYWKFWYFVLYRLFMY